MPPKIPNLLPGQDQLRSQTDRRVVDDIKQRLRRIGVNLDAFSWTVQHAFQDPNGIYFSCNDYKRLIQAAEESRKTELSFESLPNHELWQKRGVQWVGYIETDSQEPIGLDISLDNPGECRAFYVPLHMKNRGEAYRKHIVEYANTNAVYREIARRLSACNPPVVLDDHVYRIKNIGATTLDGVNFRARDYKKLKQELINAKDSTGAPFFAHAILENDDHWALKMSFMATDGTGFREVARLKLSDRPMLDGGGLGDRRDFRDRERFSGAFGGLPSNPPASPDLSSLHCAVSFDGCNIHVDDTGFVLADELGNIIVDPDVIQHFANELIFKTYGRYILPEGVVRRVNLVLPSSVNNFNRIGASVDIYNSKKFQIKATGSCSVFGASECSGVVTLSGRF